LTADSGHSTATLRLTVGDIRIAHPISVPNASVPAAEVVPALQGLVNAVVGAAEDRGATEGKTVSCRKGCGACCRQLVPISHTEGERLLAMVERLPEARQAALSARFATASAALAEAGQRDGLLDPRRRAGKTDRELSTAYFALGIACPFLEEESCSIHPERPLICREYLVTSPAELCSSPTQKGVTPLPVPKLSLAARGMDEDRVEADTMGRWFPLALLLEWSKERPKRPPVKRPGPEWVERFLRRMGH
jgi:Fe-S-cluster containining protein